jgi:hypothetical protein
MGQKLALVGVFLYGLTFLFFFWQTPLGMTPVLDGAENIRLAEEIFQGTLAQEPFYRAILYPAILSLFRLVGFANHELQALASIIGLLLHVVNAWLVGVLAWQIWQSVRPQIFAILFYGLYPPALHFAVDPLDVTMSLTFLLASAICYQSASESECRRVKGIAAGLFLGIGSLIRTNLLAFLGIWFLQLFVKKNREVAFVALLSCCLPLLFLGVINYHRSGEFRIMPWQGPFNLYAANASHADGKYFQQHLLVSDRELGQNPARLESEILFARMSGKNPPFTIAEFNSFWIRQTFDDIGQSPISWLGLLFRKAYYLANNFEQYNNKTFAFHKELSPVLRYNPLCFGLLLVFAALTLINRRFSEKLSVIIQSIVFLSFGILAFYVSARFRLIIVPFIVAISAGAVLLTKSEILAKKTLAAIVATSIVCFSSFAEVADTKTFNADRLLMAHACARLSMYERQMYWADQVLKDNSKDIQAIRLKLNAFANLALTGRFQEKNDWLLVKSQLEWLFEQQLFFVDTIFIQGCYLYSYKDQTDQAIAFWKKGLEISPQKDLFWVGLLAAGDREVDTETKILAEKSPLLWYILAHRGLVEVKDEIRFKQNEKVAKFLFKL